MSSEEKRYYAKNVLEVLQKQYPYNEELAKFIKVWKYELVWWKLHMFMSERLYNYCAVAVFSLLLMSSSPWKVYISPFFEDKLIGKTEERLYE